jgi:hypothetical protein
MQEEEAYRDLGCCARHQVEWNSNEVELGGLDDLFLGEEEFMLAEAVVDGDGVENDATDSEELYIVNSRFRSSNGG